MQGGLFRELWKGRGLVGMWGGSAYLTPRGKFKEVRYQLNQYTPLHLTEMAAESHLSGDVLSYSPLTLNKLQVYEDLERLQSRYETKHEGMC